MIDERVGDAAWQMRYALKTVSKDEDRLKPIETMLAQSLARLSSDQSGGLQSGADGPAVRLFVFAGGGELCEVRRRLAAVAAAGAGE